jgi:hypothetical protein
VDGLLRALFALIAALNAATGAPIDPNSMPDRPPIIAPTMERMPRSLPVATLAANGPTVTTAITGTITSVNGGVIVVNGQSITLGPSTQVKGQIEPGVSVKAQVRVQPDGTLEAENLEVSQDVGTPFATATLTGTPSAQTTATGTPGIMPTPSPGATLTAKPGVSPTAQPTVKATESPEAKPTVQATSQPTSKPESQPTQPQVKPTETSSDGGSGD